MTDIVHTIPLNDIIEHDTSDDSHCVCGPEIDPVQREDGSYGWHFIHHALDGREHDEPDHDKTQCPLCSGGSDAS